MEEEGPKDDQSDTSVETTRIQRNLNNQLSSASSTVNRDKQESYVTESGRSLSAGQDSIFEEAFNLIRLEKETPAKKIFINFLDLLKYLSINSNKITSR